MDVRAPASARAGAALAAGRAPDAQIEKFGSCLDRAPAASRSRHGPARAILALFRSHHTPAEDRDKRVGRDARLVRPAPGDAHPLRDFIRARLDVGPHYGHSHKRKGRRYIYKEKRNT
jgi:hypothetical protein